MILENPFYYGVFEYPKKSGNFYTGRHEPIITKELFDLVQTQVKSQFVKGESKEFAFTKLMACGLCGSGITADEKFKKQKNGNVHRYVYYGCTKVRDKNCKCGYLEEKELIRQFEGLVDKIDMNEISIKDKIKEEIKRFKKFQKLISGSNGQIEVEDIDIKNYARYILQEGSDMEKREFMNCLKSTITLMNKKIVVVA